jgi:hypothetical protein
VKRRAGVRESPRFLFEYFWGRPTHPRAAGRPLAPSTAPLPPRPESEALGVLLGDGAGAARHRKSYQTAGEALGDDLDPTPKISAAKPEAVQTPHPRGDLLRQSTTVSNTSLDAREALGYPFVAQDKSPTLFKGRALVPFCYLDER